MPKPPIEPVRLQLKWSHQFQFAGYYAAIAKGYYTEAGLAVTLFEGEPTRNPKDTVLGGEAEFGVAGSDLALGYLEGAPLVVLAAIYQHSPVALLALQSSGIRVPADLKGRRIMLQGGEASTEIYAMLKGAGVGREDFEELPLSYRHEVLLEGATDAMTVYLTDQPFFKGVPGAETVILQPLAFGVDFYGDCLFTTRTMLDEKPEQVAAFREASLRGWRYALENPGEIIAYMRQHYPGRRTEAQLLSEAEQMQALILPQLVPMGSMNPERWDRIAAAYREAGMTTSTRDLSDFQYQEDRNFDAAARRRLFRYLLSITAIIASGVAFLLFFNRRLATRVRERTAELETLNRDLEDEAKRRGDAEAAFREGEEYYRTLLERLPVGVALSRMNGDLVFVNKAYAEMIGRTVEQILQLSYWDITPEEYQDLEQSILDTLVSTGRVGAFEKEYIHADGHRIPVRLSAILVERDHETFIWAFAEDITAIREAQIALARREEQYRTIFESIPVGLLLNMPDGKVDDVNPAFYQMLGYTREEFLSLPPGYYVHPDSIGNYVGFLDTVLAGNVFRASGQNVAKDGSLIEVEVVGIPFRSRGESRVLGIVHDVTARVRAEAALHQSEERFRTIVETTKEWIWEIDINGRHIYCNPAIESILGYPPEEFLTIDTMSLIHPDDVLRVVEALPTHIERGTGWENWVLRWRHRDGSWRYLESNAAPVFDCHGNLGGFRGVDRDITDRIEAERLIRDSMEALARHQEHLEALVRERTAALEQAQADLIQKERLATLGQLIGTVSHEIRNPLGTIRGSVFSIGQMLKKQDYSRINPVLDRAERNIIRCDRIIEELLDFTRTRKLDRQSTALNAWLKDLLEDLLPSDGIEYAWNLAADTIVSIDREQFRRAIVNLVNNAAQAMEEENSSGKMLRITTAHTDREVEIEIIDQGPGIPPEHMEKIFEPLFSTKGFGVGLGVPIIRDIIEAHGGRIAYESTVGQGTTVRIWLPVG
jgi:PAS domain S-box-containing protein